MNKRFAICKLFEVRRVETSLNPCFSLADPPMNSCSDQDDIAIDGDNNMLQEEGQGQNDSSTSTRESEATTYTYADQLASSSASYAYFNIRRLFFATMFIAVAIVVASVIGYSGGGGLLYPRVLTKLKLVDVNAPPVANDISRKTSKPTKAKKERRRMHKSELLQENSGDDDDDDIKPLLVVKANDDQIPAGIPDSIFGASNVVLHASDALECRESVINFVINATDGKDECDGLKRAFDKTCNSDAPEEDAAKARTTAANRNQPEPARRRRLTFESSQPDFLHRKLKALAFKTRVWIQTTLLQPLLPQPSVAFFAEDEVAGRAWKDAQYLVDHGLDSIVHIDLSRRLKTKTAEEHVTPLINVAESKDSDTSATKEIVREVERRGISIEEMEEQEQMELIKEGEDEVPTNEVDAEEMEPDPTATKEPKLIVKPKQSLTLPTANQHVSDTMLSETLLLQKEDTIQKVFDVFVNQTNITLNDAAVDAATSSKAVQEASAAVSAVLNDPTSVEARTCCASILSVFHENCDSPDEEVVSDKKLFLIVFVLALCGMVKSLIRHFQIRWLPEAAGCILVGGKACIISHF